MAAPGTRLLSDALAEQLRDCRIDLRRPIGGGRAGSHRSLRHGACVEFADFRPYTPGDPPQLIDWQVYARSDRHLVRRHEEETVLRAWILLDRSESLDWRGSGPHSKARHASLLAAAIAWVLVHQGDSVGLVHFTDRITGRIPPCSGAAGLQHLLASLEQFVFAGRIAIAESLDAFLSEGHPPGLIVLISDCLEEAPRLQRAVAHALQAGHHLRLLHVVDRDELQAPWQGLLECRALEGGGQLVVEMDALRDAYRQAVRSHIDALRSIGRSARADYSLCPTDESPVHVLRAGGSGGRAL